MTQPMQDATGLQDDEVYTFPLSSAQQMLWLAAQMGADGPAYHVPAGYRLSGPLDAAPLERALREMVARHEVLRTTFAVVDGEPAQIVSPGAELALERVDLEPLPAGERDAALAERLAEEARRSFDLVRGPLFRATLFRLSAERHALLLNAHHLVWDGWSDGVFVRELEALYAAFRRGEDSPLEELPIQYGDYATWEREALEGEAGEALVEWWRARLAGAPERLDLPADRPRPAEPSGRGGMHAFTVPGATSAALAALAREAGATTFAAVLAGYGVLLHRLSGEGEVLVGAPVVNRGQVELESLIGPLVNTVVLRLDLRGDPTFRELVGRARETIFAMQEHQELPFARLVSELAPRRDFSRGAFFQVMLNFADAGPDSPAAGEPEQALGLEPFEVRTGGAKYDLLLGAQGGPDGISCGLEYAEDLFDAATGARMGEQLRVLLDGAAADPECRISRLPLMEAAERSRVVSGWNATDVDYADAGLSLPALVERQAARTPDAAALVFEGGTVTFRALNERANRLARRLRALGVGAESRVGICAERSPELVAGILGVLKAGGAYVPVDPTYPAGRLAYMLADSAVAAVLAQDRFVPLVSGAASVVRLEDGYPDEDGADLGIAIDPAQLAYVIYTSGSTGLPKGAMNAHRGVVNRLLWMQDALGLSAGDAVLQKTPFGFDVSVWEFLWPLVTGARLVLARPEGHRDPAYLAGLVEEAGITTCHFVPSMLSVFLDGVGAGRCPGLRRVVCSGEALPPALAGRFFAAFPGVELHNLYGPTEAAVDVTWWPCTAEDAEGGVPIGRPIANTRTYVLDGQGSPLPAGVSGELYLAGVQVGRGYHGRAALTAERFVPDPFSGHAGARMYRTGDRVRWTGEGALEYLCRTDFQVKVRGLRIEPGEIETALLRHESVSEASVIVRGTGEEAALVAYVVPRGEPASAGVLRAFLGTTLPDYMVPGAVVTMDALPLSPNGKLDRAALPAPLGRCAVDGAYAPARTLVEETLAAIWAAVLGVDKVGVHDNFYELGGDSIRILNVVALARERGIRIAIRDVARHPTIAALAAAAGTGDGNEGEEMHGEPFSLVSAEDRALLPAGLDDAYPLTRMQLGMLYHREHAPDSAMYHYLASWRLGVKLDLDAFRRAALAAAERHPVLRTTFDLQSYGEPLQLVHAAAAFPVECHDLRGADAAEQERVLAEFFAAEQARPFPPASAPQLRFHLHRRDEGTVQFTLVQNHALFDGWSLQTLLGEVLASYLALARGEEMPALPELATTFRDFVRLERRALESVEAREFWAQRLDGFDPAPLPRDAAPGAAPLPRVRRESRVLRRPLLRALRAVARRQSVPLKSVLLAAHFKVLQALGGRSDVVSGLSTNGRPETTDGERVAGLFLNTLPLRVELHPGSWSDLVLRAHEAELAVLPYRRYPLSAIQAEHGGAAPLFDASFVYLNFHQVGDQLAGGELVPLSTDAAVEETNFALMTSFQHVPGPGGRVLLSVEADRTVFSDERIREIDALYRRVLAAIAENEGAAHDAFDPLSPAAREEVLRLGQGEGPVPLEAPVHVLFARNAAAEPDRPALVWSGGSLTRGEVNGRADAVARRLQALGVCPGDRVAVVMDRAPEAVVALLAAWKAGAAYVPVDPAYPADRLGWVLRDAGAAAVVTLERWMERVGEAGLPVLTLDAPLLPSAGGDEPPAEHDDPAALAYVVYTSGTTGRPKGVMVEHRQVMHYTGAVRGRLQVPADARWLLVSTFAADLGNTALFPALAGGGVVHVASEAEATDPAALDAFLAAHPVDAMKVVPSHLRALLAHEHAERLLPRTHLVLGGDASDWGLLARVRALAPALRVFNHYGPTETTVGVVAGELHGPDAAAPPLGRPLGHAHARVLDAAGRMAPAGTPGELYLGGAGVARGYLGNPRLTAQRFVPAPFGAVPGARLYRTGDRARWLPGGRLEFLGRADQQVKVRGYRVEPREVEMALRLHPGVETAAVVARPDEDGVQLVGYLVPAQGTPPAEAELRVFMEARLPAYMVPAAFVRLDALPLTANGKLDRARLPAPEAPGAAAAAEGLPRTETEERVLALWRAVLGVEHVGVHDRFLELGGNSIRAILLAARIRKGFGVPISVETLLTAETPAGLAGSIDMALNAGGTRDAPPITPVPRDGELPLSYAQQRLWYTTLLDPGSPAHNIPFTFRLRGALDVAAWRGALDEVVRRHEVLRSRFPTVDGEPRQVIDPPAPVALRETDLRGVPAAEREAALVAELRRGAWLPFDLGHGPLVRAGLARVGDEEYGAVLAFHHIVFDGWSAGVLLQELAALYTSFRAGLPSPLPALATQYADFAAWQRARLDGEALEEQVSWWRGRLAGVPALGLPADHPRPERPSLRGGSEAAAWPRELVDALRDTSRREGVTLFMTLLAGYGATLAAEAGQDDFAVGCPVAVHRDREELHGTIGLFLNSLPVRLDLAGAPTFRELLVRVRRAALEAYAHQDVPFEKVVDALRLPRDPARTPVFQVWFNHSEMGGEPLRFEGLALEGIDAGDPAAKFDLRLGTAEDGEGGLSVSLGYDAALFEPATVRRILARLESLMARAAAAPEQPLAVLYAALADEERAEQLLRAETRERSLRSHLQGGRRRAVEIEA
ncbi:MAG TPA: amino acid adenylation domain-containing protein [Longimicrobium sp.]|nr:amino acid adenylation domain-containing protein [Longimicrobium sp.]